MERPRLTISDIRDLPTISVEQFGDVMGLGRASAYAAVRAGEVPTVRIGRRILVPVPALLRMLDGTTSHQPAV